MTPMEISPEEKVFWETLGERVDMNILNRIELVEKITGSSRKEFQICVSAIGTHDAKQTCNSAGNS